jgi:excinuclease ABC subunit A
MPHHRYRSGSGFLFGGELVAQGTFDQILKSTSLTAKYLNGFRNFTLKNGEIIQNFH